MGGAQQAGGSCCGSRTSISSVARRNTSRASTTTSPGWGSIGRSRRDGSREHFAEYKTVLDLLIREELVYPSFMSRSEIRAFISEAETPKKPWPRDPDGVPLYPGADRELSSRERRRRVASGTPYAWRLDVAAALARVIAAAVLDRIHRRVLARRRKRSMRVPHNGAMSCSPAGTCRPAIIFLL